jgi:hypothetical protein
VEGTPPAPAPARRPTWVAENRTLSKSMPLNVTPAPAPADGTTTRAVVVAGGPMTRTRGAGAAEQVTVMDAPAVRAGSVMAPPVRVTAVTLGSKTMVVLSPGWAPARALDSASRRLPAPAVGRAVGRGERTMPEGLGRLGRARGARTHVWKLAGQRLLRLCRCPGSCPSPSAWAAPAAACPAPTAMPAATRQRAAAPRCACRPPPPAPQLAAC